MSVSNRFRLAVAAMTCGVGLLTPMRADAVLVPSGRWDHAMAAEPGVGGKLVMFGGRNGNSFRPNAETWAWNGSKWSLPATGLGPPARFGHAMATDKATGTIVMFGGISFDGLALRDTWVWTPADRSWTNATPLGLSPVPSEYGPSGLTQSHLSMAYDGVSKRVVLVMGPRFAGVFDATQRDPETWTWNGVDRTWTRELAPSPTPEVMAYDAAHSQVVLFGDDGGTWTWSGSTRVWTLRAPVASPDRRDDPAMAFDAKRNRVVLFGGYSRTTRESDETWTWDGNTWTLQQPSTKPGARWGHVMAYHAGTERIVVNGHFQFQDSPTDTWGYTKTWTQLA